MNKEAQPTPGMGPTPPGGRFLHGVDWAVKAGVVDEVMLGTRVRVRRRRQRRLAAASGLAVVALACGLWFSRRIFTPAPMNAASAIVDMPQRMTLVDGSVVELKDDSKISVAFTPEIRRVALVNGEAHFQVAKNKDRPFVVVSGDVEVRAVGTAFSVQRTDTSVEVLVTEGRVTLDRLPAGTGGAEVNAPQTGAAPHALITLDAGNRAVVDIADTAVSPPLPTVQSVSASEVSQRLAWRVPRLEFTQTPLSQVVTMINEHGQERISLADPSLENVRISGILRADNIETLLRLLDAEHGIKAERRPDGEVVLTRGR